MAGKLIFKLEKLSARICFDILALWLMISGNRCDLYKLLYIWLMHCLCYRLAARTKAALMLPKYGCTGTPHPSVVQTSVLVL